MIFLSYWFAACATVFFATFWIIRDPLVRRLILLVACIVFQVHFAGPAGVAPVFFLAAVSYFAGLQGGRAAPLLGIIICGVMLGAYKYSIFLAGDVLGLVSTDLSQRATAFLRGLLPAAPPLGISFFVFEFVHYLADVRQGSPHIRNPLDFALFGTFWPSLVAGPIKRYQQFLPALGKGVASLESQDVAIGLLRISTGVIKKVTADYLGQIIGFWDSQMVQLGHWNRIMLVIAIGVRILLDFSGYSDMAIGFARMAGIRLPENFRWPYLATNLVSFWQRWHISLSTWIRDYIYIALGGGRHGTARRIFNGLIAFSLCGLWHGAGWNFILWGIYHGCGLGITVIALRGASRVRDQLPLPVRYAGMAAGWLLTTIFVMVGWLLFFYPVPTALDMLRLCILG